MPGQHARLGQQLSHPGRDQRPGRQRAVLLAMTTGISRVSTTGRRGRWSWWPWYSSGPSPLRAAVLAQPGVRLPSWKAGERLLKAVERLLQAVERLLQAVERLLLLAVGCPAS